jgi:hypothetical protein
METKIVGDKVLETTEKELETYIAEKKGDIRLHQEIIDKAQSRIQSIIEELEKLVVKEETLKEVEEDIK